MQDIHSWPLTILYSLLSIVHGLIYINLVVVDIMKYYNRKFYAELNSN